MTMGAGGLLDSGEDSRGPEAGAVREELTHGRADQAGRAEADLAYWVALNQVPELGPVSILRLVRHFGTARQAWEASPGDLEQVAGIYPRMRAGLVAARQRIEPDRLLEQVMACGFHIYTLADAGYPLSLKRINAPPPVLYVRGDLAACQGMSWIGIVGTRKATAYGRHVAKTLAFDLAISGLGVVSGLARGIDSAAHRGALAAGGVTAAVLGSGLDIIYPPENKDLAAEIAAGGVLMSEFPPGTRPLSQNFPRRNRIISGLALGIVVVEAGEKSGALITADLALEQGREVFAVPGPVTSPVSAGPNRLIIQGARLVESAADILEELSLPRLWAAGVEVAAEAQAAIEPPEREVLSALAGGPVQLEVLAEQVKLPVAELLGLLTVLEVRGLVHKLPGSFFVAASRSGPSSER